MRKTKIVCTIGPATRSAEAIMKLIAAGMNVARLNFSHEDHAAHLKVIRTIRDCSEKIDQPVAILQDLAGPKIRTGTFENGPVTLEFGQKFTLTGRKVAGNSERVGLTYKDLARDVSPRDTLLLADGTIELIVESVSGLDINCKVVVGGTLSSHKGINLPDKSINAPILNSKDRKDLKFGLEHGVDFVALSFVRNPDDIREAREIINESGHPAELIAKIEKHEALENIDRIIDAVDGLMVARGDLGVEIPIEDVPRVQKMLINKANHAGKPVITATQMLKSMVDNPRPTRSEVTDIANAILDGSDAVMLSEETAIGDYPIEAVMIMSKIAERADDLFPNLQWLSKFEKQSLSTEEAVAYSACQIAARIGAAAITSSTKSGSTTRNVAKYRPSQPILAMTPDMRTCRRLCLVWGAIPFLIDETDNTDCLERISLAKAKSTGDLSSGDTIVFTAGVPLNVKGTTNLIKIATIE
ncbi:pyruvate kinase [bacterium]|nr:pyruvate kinase [bacterium]